MIFYIGGKFGLQIAENSIKYRSGWRRIAPKQAAAENVSAAGCDRSFSSSSGAISRSWRSNENIGVCDYGGAFTTQRTTLGIIPVRIVEVPTRKLEHVDLKRLV